MTKSAHPIKNIRTFALPNETQPYTFAMKFEYDSWNRIQTIVYPDGEKVHYDYNLGGMLQSVVGDKGAQQFVYVKDIVYNKFELKEFVGYGNGTETYYKYDILQRLLHLYSENGAGEAMQNIKYKYDAVSNITGIDNGAGVLNNGLGGKYSNSYSYDNLYRLAYAKGQWNGSVPCNFDMKMGYTDNGRIKMKQQYAVTFLSGVLSQSSYENNYYYSTTQPNTVRHIHDAQHSVNQDFGWDANGNLVFHHAEVPALARRLCWDEENRLMGVADNSYTSFYQYDAAGERTYKLTGEQHKQIVNGQTYTYCYLDNPTLYASPYLVATPKGYTKHYYAESERIASKIGGENFRLTIFDFRMNKMSGNEEYFEHNITAWSILSTQYHTLPSSQNRQSKIENRQSYHPDHLGSSSWITYSDGKSIQHLHYLPFGESFVDQRVNGYFAARYTFSAKEKDTETGYGYFGARYYSSDLSIWISVDPMSDKYPSMSAYVYCANNPVKLVDPNGRSISEFDENGNYLRTIKDNWFHNTFVGRFGRIVDGDGNVTQKFKFADPKNDVNDLKNGKITRVQFVQESEIKKMLSIAGAFNEENKVTNSDSRYDYISQEGQGGGKFDFSYTGIPNQYSDASSDPLNNPSSMLFLVDGVAHNQMNFGNFLFGAAGKALGLTGAELIGGAHYNSLFNSESNGYRPQLDSRDDQRSIRMGVRYANKQGYKNMQYRIIVGTLKKL